MARDIYQEITDKIIGYLEEGVVPWRHPISDRGGAGFPKNLTTAKNYRGVNVFMLGMTAWFEGYSSSNWLTFNQCKKLGGQVKKGEKASLVTFWKLYDKKDKETGEVTQLPVLKHYNVFNAEQCDGIEDPDATEEKKTIDFHPIEEAQRIVDGYKNPPEILHTGQSAIYYPGEDRIKIAPPERFESSEAYYATLYHEMTHSTGTEKRLSRPDIVNVRKFGTKDYSSEELVAEMGSAFLAAHAGISLPTIEQSAAYIDGWKRTIKMDKKLVIQAAGKAQKATDYILGLTFAEASNGNAKKEEPKKEPAPVEQPKPEPKAPKAVTKNDPAKEKQMGFGW